MDALDFVALGYAVLAAGVVVHLVRNGRATFDDELSARDQRLGGAAVFYLAIPLLVGATMLAEVGVGTLLGGHVDGYRYIIFWGAVNVARNPAFGALEESLLAATGLLAPLLVAALSIAWTVWAPRNAARNFVRLELARIALWLWLLVLPAVSLLLGEGGITVLRRTLNAVQSLGGDAFVVLWFIGAWRVWMLWRGPWRPVYLRLASPLRDRIVKAERRVADDPDDVEALRQLGRAHLVGDDTDRALLPIEEALARAGDHPETRMLAGVVQLRLGEAKRAADHLRSAGTLLEELSPLSREQTELLFEVTLGLAAARLALDDVEGAVLTAEEAGRQRPRDPRSVLMTADALLAAGRLSEARRGLERALEGASGTFRGEIQRRLRLLD